MGESIRNVGADLSAQAAAAQSSEDVKKKKEDTAKVKTVSKDLKLENLPKAADAKVSVEEKKETAAPSKAAPTEETSDIAESILTDIDKQLENVQKGLKDFIAKKIRLAAKKPEKSKDLLMSAYKDTNKAYAKIKKVRDQLS